ncbi:hypothetical protein TB1_021740 [Malus domestica]
MLTTTWYCPESDASWPSGLRKTNSGCIAIELVGLEGIDYSFLRNMRRVEARKSSRVAHAQRNQPSAVVFIGILQQQAEDAFDGDCRRSGVNWCNLEV